MLTLRARSCIVVGSVLVATVLVTEYGVAQGDSGGQQPGGQPANAASVERVRGCMTPVSERKTEAGCYTTAEAPLGILPAGRLYWHVYSYPTPPAPKAARGP